MWSPLITEKTTQRKNNHHAIKQRKNMLLNKEKTTITENHQGINVDKQNTIRCRNCDLEEKDKLGVFVACFGKFNL